MKKVVIIHTSFISVETLKKLFAEIVPEVELHHIVDDTLLPEIMQSGGVTDALIKRYCAYAVQAESAGADMIFNQCSSIGPAADVAKQMLGIPLLKVDQAMAEEAVEKGTNISVVATIGTTLKPSVALIESVAKEKGKPVNIESVLLPSAYEALFLENDVKKHNKIVSDKIREIEKFSDVIVLAQGSMITLVEEIKDISVPLLTSPRSGVTRVRQVLGLD